MEILGNNLKTFFDEVDLNEEKAKITYCNRRYEIWEVSEDLFELMCSMKEEVFRTIAGNEAWWRSSSGCILGRPDAKYKVNGKYLIGWDSSVYKSKRGKKFDSLTEYLCECVGASTGRNVCACAVDLAKYNGMTMAELFKKYEG